MDEAGEVDGSAFVSGGEAAAVLEFDGDWADLDARSARLTAVISGRDVNRDV